MTNSAEMLGELAGAEKKPAGLKPFEPDRIRRWREADSKNQPAAIAAFFNGETMQIIINGEQRSFTPQTMLQLLQSLEIDPRKVAVELNMDILPKAEYESTTLADGDRIEIVHFVGGG